jgi:cell shape-determining protein MreC
VIVLQAKLLNELEDTCEKASEKAAKSRENLQHVIESYKKKFNGILHWLQKAKDAKKEVLV